MICAVDADDIVGVAGLATVACEVIAVVMIVVVVIGVVSGEIVDNDEVDDPVAKVLRFFTSEFPPQFC